MTRKMNCLFALPLAAGLAACGGDDTNNNNNNNTNNNNTTNNNTNCDLTTSAGVLACMEGKTYYMAGSNIPTHPNGYSQDVNFGAATQCYFSTTIAVANGVLNVTAELGVLSGAPMTLDVGTCDTSMKSGVDFMATSQAVLIENTTADCFDIEVNYGDYAQQGRGKLNADGSQMSLELYFKDDATGYKCADGAVGSGAATVRTAEFTGDAEQVYVAQ